VPFHPRLAVTTAEAAIDAAVAGLGMTRVLSYMIEGARRGGELEIVLERFEPAPWPVNLVYLEKGLVPLKLRAFLDWATPRLKTRMTGA
jgi:DNA-binding transcriptional LysR family regulator